MSEGSVFPPVLYNSVNLVIGGRFDLIKSYSNFAVYKSYGMYFIFFNGDSLDYNIIDLLHNNNIIDQKHWRGIRCGSDLEGFIIDVMPYLVFPLADRNSIFMLELYLESGSGQAYEYLLNHGCI